MPGLIPPQKLEEIRAASDIVDVISGYLGPLKRAGANFVALCPFHREKSPSFNVNPGRQIFHCFGCHKGGDVFTFVKEYENLSFIEAVRRLAERARIVLEFEDNPHAKQQRGEKESLLLVHEEICKRWQTALANDPAGQIARDYLAKRGVPAEAVKLFRLGYAPDLWDDTVNWAKSKQFDLALVERGGLIIRKEGADHFYDRFRGRLMFPICDEQGRVIGFSGRVLAGDEKTAKYVNSPETPIFKKGKVLFALDKARRSILDAGAAVVCEGQLDTISCHSQGITNVVAPQGTALTGQHVNVLSRYTDDIILCFDGDNAGRKAAARGFQELVELGVPFRVAEVPAPHDPDSYIKSFGQKAFFELVVGAKDFFAWYLDYLIALHGLTHDKGRLAVMKGMFDVLTHPKNMVLVDTHLQKTAARLQVPELVVRAEFKKAQSNRIRETPRVTSPGGPGGHPDIRRVPPPSVPPAQQEPRKEAPTAPVARAGGFQPPPVPSTPKGGGDKPAPQTAADPDHPPDDYYDSQPAAPIEGHSSDALPGAEPAPEPQGPPSKQEFWLLQALFHADDQMEWLAATLQLDWLTHPGVRKIVALRLAESAAGHPPSPAQLLGELPDDATRALCTQAMAESDRMLADPADVPGTDPLRAARIKADRAKARHAMLRDALTRLRNEHLDRRMADLNRELNAPHLEDSEQNAILREREQLRQQKKLPLA